MCDDGRPGLGAVTVRDWGYGCIVVIKISNLLCNLAALGLQLRSRVFTYAERR